jgi:hypothetical protein
VLVGCAYAITNKFDQCRYMHPCARLQYHPLADCVNVTPSLRMQVSARLLSTVHKN